MILADLNSNIASAPISVHRILDNSIRSFTKLRHKPSITPLPIGYPFAMPCHASPAIHRIVCDDAKQFYYITTLRALCWVHEERHYKMPVPFLPNHQKLVGDFRSRIWDYYYERKEYKKNPKGEYKMPSLSSIIPNPP